MRKTLVNRRPEARTRVVSGRFISGAVSSVPSRLGFWSIRSYDLRLRSAVISIPPDLALILSTAFLASLASLYLASRDGLLIAFQDAQSRLLLARLVIDSNNPGLTQIGGVWPPVPQLFMVPLSAFNGLFHSGLAGAPFSMLSYLLAIAVLYKFLFYLTNDKIATLAGIIAFSTPDLLFMQATPMSEMPFIAFILVTAYSLMRWERDVEDLKFLFFTGISLTLAALTRYEGWFYLPIVSFLVLLVCINHHFALDKLTAHLTFFGVAAISGIGLWLAWNQIIFGDVLFFTRSEFSAGAIAARTVNSLDAAHQTRHNLPFVLEIWGRTCIDIVGYGTLLVALLGGLLLTLSKRGVLEKLICISLIFPTVFYVGTMYLGLSTVIWHPAYFNGLNWGTRYATLMMPAVAVFTATLLRNRHLALKVGVIAIVVVSGAFSLYRGLLTVDEALVYPNYPATKMQDQMAMWLKDHYDRGQVLLFRVNNERVMFSAGIPLNDYVFEGSNQDYWRRARQNPVDASIDWIVMRFDNGEPDQIWKDLHDAPVLFQNYTLVYQDAYAQVYKIRAPEDMRSSSR